MLLSEFDFHLPEALIAQQPVNPRDASRLLYVKHDGSVLDSMVADLASLLREGDLLVFNNTKVIPARLVGLRNEARVEVTLHRQVSEGWEVFARPGRKLKPGDIVKFSDGFQAEVINKTPDGSVILKFNTLPTELVSKLERYGQMPLPPYIRRTHPQEADTANYQTIYAEKAGAVAAPTAGLHFTENLLASLHAKNIEQSFVTLHVGGGTFLPVKTDDIRQHKMHYEWVEISAATASKINQAKQQGRRIVAIGTTSMRVLETVTGEDGLVKPFHGETNIFITPGYRFKCVDVLFTNFHLPKSTLFMLVSAFSGLPEMQHAYSHAIAQQYRFFSYGDACLLEKKQPK